jgi:hypothetical protein
VDGAYENMTETFGDTLVIDPVSKFISGRTKVRPVWAVGAVDALIEKMNKRGLWPTVELLITIWLKRNPDKAREFMRAKDDVSRTRDTDTASSQNLSHRYLLEVPDEIVTGIDILWGSKIKDKKEFWRDFAKQFPMFRVAEKV